GLSRTVVGEPQGEDEATVLLINTYRTPVSGVFRRKDFWFRGLWRKPGQRFAVCGGDPAWQPRRRAGGKRQKAGRPPPPLLGHCPLGLDLLEYRRFLKMHPDIVGDEHQQEREQERDAPAPVVERGLAEIRCVLR